MPAESKRPGVVLVWAMHDDYRQALKDATAVMGRDLADPPMITRRVSEGLMGILLSRIPSRTRRVSAKRTASPMRVKR